MKQNSTDSGQKGPERDWNSPALAGPASLSASDDLVREQAYLISRGVRPLSIVESIDPDESGMHAAFCRLQDAAAPYQGAIPFVLPMGDDGSATAGFAAEQWVVDLLGWSYANAPARHHSQIVGLLLGYTPRAIAVYDEYRFTGYPAGDLISPPNPTPPCSDKSGVAG